MCLYVHGQGGRVRNLLEIYVIVTRLDLMVVCLDMSFWRFGSFSSFSVVVHVEIICLSFLILLVMGDFLVLFSLVGGLHICVIALIALSWAVCMML